MIEEKQAEEIYTEGTPTEEIHTGAYMEDIHSESIQIEESRPEKNQEEIQEEVHEKIQEDIYSKI